MAQNVVLVDFNTLKFNLYEVLNIEKNASDSEIKKAFKKLILKFHPDKNNDDVDEEIYNHIITANQVLSNKDLRKKYDDFLVLANKTFYELKKNFDPNPIKLSEDDAAKEFEIKKKKIIDKHGGDKLNESYYPKSLTMSNYEKMLKDRQVDINIPKENIVDIKDFNNKFENKKDNNIFKDELIVVKEKEELSLANVNNNFTTLDLAFDTLYIDGGGVNTDNYSSLESAFKIQPVKSKDIKEVDMEAEIKKYKNTDFTKNVKFSKDVYETW